MIRMIGRVRQDATIHATYIYCAVVTIFVKYFFLLFEIFISAL